MTITFRSFKKHPCLVKVNNFPTGVKVHNMGAAYAERWGHLDVIITTIEGGHYQAGRNIQVIKTDLFCGN